MADIYVARNGFACTGRSGERVIVYAGDTVEAGHWLLASNPESFAPIDVKYPAPVRAGKVKTEAA